jgi:uncharacterized small protein (DUF1192 family)
LSSFHAVWLSLPCCVDGLLQLTELESRFAPLLEEKSLLQAARESLQTEKSSLEMENSRWRQRVQQLIDKYVVTPAFTVFFVVCRAVSSCAMFIRYQRIDPEEHEKLQVQLLQLRETMARESEANNARVAALEAEIERLNAELRQKQEKLKELQEKHKDLVVKHNNLVGLLRETKQKVKELEEEKVTARVFIVVFRSTRPSSCCLLPLTNR